MSDIKYKSARDYLLSRESPKPFTSRELSKLEKEQGLSKNPKIRELQHLNMLIEQYTKNKQELECISNAHLQLSPETQDKLNKEIVKKFTDPRPEATRERLKIVLENKLDKIAEIEKREAITLSHRRLENKLAKIPKWVRWLFGAV